MHSRLQSYQALILIVLSVLTGCSNDVPKLAPLPYDATILAFGDSITYGTGANRNESYPEVLSRKINLRIINAGIPGDTTGEGLERLPESLNRYNPDLVLLCLGGNDFIRRKSASSVKANLQAMIDILISRSIPVVLIAVPPPAIFLDTEPLYSELGELNGIPVENEILEDILGNKSLKADTIHPNAEGYRIMAEAIADLLHETGAI